MFFWIAPPKDSCETPICSERKRELPPIFAASIWSSDGALGPVEFNRVQVISAQSDCGWPAPPYVLSSPLRTRMSSFRRPIGVRQGVMS